MSNTTQSTKSNIAVIGAGTMGSGIAQLAILNGHSVFLVDSNAASLARGKELIFKNLEREVQNKRVSKLEADASMALLKTSAMLVDCANAHLVIEAIVESLPAKEALFAALEEIVPTDSILATNTSSLSVAALAGKRRFPTRVIGMHFFNPAPVMKLVEVVPGALTDNATITSTVALLKSWKKTTVIAKDTPGFIVNRVARPYYGEALRIAEEGIEFAVIDASMRALGFKMGPFELMDLIGNDINYAVTCSVFEAFYYDSRYRPSILQRRMVENNLLGRKTKRGFFTYETSLEQANTDAQNTENSDTKISDRIVAMLINEAAEALRLKVASAIEIDLSMTLGVNYPKGLLQWCDELGAEKIVNELQSLHERYGEERYRVSPILKDLIKTRSKFH